MVRLLDLTRVLVAPATAEGYAEAEPAGVAEHFRKAGEACCGMSSLYRGHTLRVVECAPFTRGVVTADTIVVVLRPAPAPAAEPAPPPQQTAPSDPLLMLSAFCRPKAAAVAVRCRFPAFDHRHGAAEPAQEVWHARASQATADRLRLWDGSWLQVAEADGGAYCVRVNVHSSVRDDALHVTAAAFCQIFRHRVGLRDLRTEDGSGAEGQVTVLGSMCSVPADATAVEVRPVRSPALVELPSELVDDALREYFAEPRTLHVGDVVAAPVACGAGRAGSVLTMLMEGAEDPAAEPFPEVVHFVVTKASSGSTDFPSPAEARALRSASPHCFVVRQKTTRLAYQTRPVACPLPCRAPVGESGLLGTAPLRELAGFLSEVLSVEGYASSCLLVGTEENAASETLRLACGAVGCHLLSVSCQTGAKELDEVQRLVGIAADSAPCVLALRHVEAHFPPRAAQQGQAPETPTDNLTSCIAKAMRDKAGVITICCAATDEGLPSSFLNGFDRVLKLDNPSQPDRKVVAATLLERVSHSCAVTADSLSKQTAGLPFSAMPQIFACAARACVARVFDDKELWASGCDVPARTQLVLSTADFTAAIEGYSKAHQVNVTTNVQKVGWKDIGGLRQPKEEILQCIHLPLSQPELFASSGLKARTGILMFGPPGCGKTLLAKGVATECGLNFMSVKGPELINMYVGESERNIRELFHKARQAAPCIVFFDELDALAPNRGVNGDSGGVMDRIVSQLLTEVDGLGGDPSQFVFVIGATNRPDLLDSALLRPGRFDRCVYLGVSASAKEQANILKAQTRKMNLASDVDFMRLVEDMPRTYSGADLSSLSTEAMMLAMRERIDDLVGRVEARRLEQADRAARDEAEDEEEEGGDGGEMAAIEICQSHFEAARASVKPSVTPADLKRYEELREKFM